MVRDPVPKSSSHNPNVHHTGMANQQLLLSILAVHEVKVDFNAVANVMGDQCTPRAVQEQLKKLKKMAAENTGNSDLKAGSPKVSIRTDPSFDC